MTEEEAETKWCPFTRAADLDGNRGAVSGHEHPQTMCVSSACMAWRWVHKAGTNKNDQPNYYAGQWHGYCGLAGKP